MIDYSGLAANFADSGYSPAEIHGLVTAFCCAAGSLNELKKILSQEDDGNAANEVHRMYQVINTELSDNDLTFHPVLTSTDDDPLQQKTRALGQWCQGFILGAGMTHLTKKAQLSEECLEALVFFKEVVQIEDAAEESSEEDEKDFFELEEYIRLSVLMIYTELRVEQEESQSTQTH